MRLRIFDFTRFGKSNWPWWAAVWLGVILWPAVSQVQIAWGQAFIEQITPPLVERGKTTRLTLRGTETRGALDLWTSLPAGVFKVAPVGVSDDRQATFDVEVAPTAPLGLYGLRLATTSGLSNVHLFLVDELPTVAADELRSANDAPLALPKAVWGVCRPAQTERFAIDVSAGQRLAFEVVGSRLGKEFDPLVTIYDARGQVVAQHDNDGGLFFDCRFEHTFAAAGRHTVELRDARFHGDDRWSYVLRIGNFPACRVAVPSSVRPGLRATLTFPQAPGQTEPLALAADFPRIAFFHDLRLAGNDISTWLPLVAADCDNHVETEPNDTPETATLVAIPANLHGCLAMPGDHDWFAFELAQGQKLEFRGESGSLGSAADLELAIVDPTGREVQRIDDVQLDEASFRMTAGTAGPHKLLVRDMARDGGPDFAYRIEVRPAGRKIDLTTDVAGVTVPQGTYQALPLTITRTEYTGPIELALVGSPPGLKLLATTVPAEATDFVTTLAADGSATLGTSTVRIAARGTAGPVSSQTTVVAPETVVRTRPVIDRQLVNVDLIPIALRDDQRRPPPSLTDCFAVQVTPHAPFDVELPKPLITLARYQTAELPIQTTRATGFTAPIQLTVRGGQLGNESEFRSRVFGRIADATPEAAVVTGVLYSRNLVQTIKQRGFLDATVVYEGRKITLTRSFELDVRTAHRLSVEPLKLTLSPGGTARVKLLVDRVPTFRGSVTVKPALVAGLSLPDEIVIAEGQEAAEVELKISAEFKPRTFRVRLPASARVEPFQEDTPGVELEIEVKAAEARKP
ncbi:MAG TPA: hypothetical protein VMV69_11865 [Pirellulales bacterium]|nr:hypothetical protein [Pirellulales bacterium]